MAIDTIEISVKGKPHNVPVTYIDGKAVVVRGSCLKVAEVFDEEWLDGEVVENPDQFVLQLKAQHVKAELFTFTETFQQNKLKAGYFIEWDNLAVIPTASYKEWWEKRISQDGRRNVRIAAKKGVIVKQVPFNDELVKGIQGIYDEAPVRQGRKFWHYGKDLAAVRRENATYLDKSIFIGAYVDGELIGFIKMVVVGRAASIMQIISKNSHFDCRPGNALIAKAVEICEQQGLAYLIYCKYVYPGREDSLLTEFKRRNGFERFDHPRYFIPLTPTGKLALKLRLHNGIKGFLPDRLGKSLIQLREKLYRMRN